MNRSGRPVVNRDQSVVNIGSAPAVAAIPAVSHLGTAADTDMELSAVLDNDGAMALIANP